jgi:hypothetical protein
MGCDDDHGGWSAEITVKNGITVDILGKIDERTGVNYFDRASFS